MKINNLLVDRKTGDYICMGSSAVTLILLIVYAIYGAVFNYFDTVVFGFLLLGMILGTAAAVLAGRVKMTGLLKLLAVMLTAGAFALFFYNSFPVWADGVNHITMYNSRGGLTPVICLCVIFVIDLIGLIVSCFMRDGGEA